MSQNHKCLTYILFLSSVNITSENLIDNVISFIKGGTKTYAFQLKEKLLKGAKMVDVSDFVNWSSSLTDAPILLNPRVRNVYFQIEDFVTFLLNVTVGLDEQLT